MIHTLVVSVDIRSVNGIISVSFPGTSITPRFIQLDRGQKANIHLTPKYDGGTSDSSNIEIKTSNINTIKQCRVGKNTVQCYYATGSKTCTIVINLINSISVTYTNLACNYANVNFFACTLIYNKDASRSNMSSGSGPFEIDIIISYENLPDVTLSSRIYKSSLEFNIAAV